MRIIREGKLPDEEIRQACCRKCQTLFEFKVGEARQTSDRNESFLIVNCPLPGCGESIWFPLHDRDYRGRSVTIGATQWDR